MLFCLLFGGNFSKWRRRPIWRPLVLTLLAATTSVKCQLFEEWSEESDELVPTVDTEAVLGGTATFPCNIEPETPDDIVYMVLWFRSKIGKPLYSFDVRGRPSNNGAHWSDPEVFGPRAHLITRSSPAVLKVDSITLADEGEYRCRVDFKNSPTRNCRVRLKIIVPPKNLSLRHENGSDIAGVIGPLEDGTDVTLTCQVSGGRPQPRLSWFINGKTISYDSHMHFDSDTTVSTLRLLSVDRSWLNTTVRCQVSNSRLLSPYEKTARIEMNLRPLSITIVSKPTRFLANQETVVECIVHGSRPPARIIWFRDEEIYARGKISEHKSSSFSASSLKVAARPEDNGSRLKCQADNPALQDSMIDDSLLMNVVYRPIVSLTLGSTLNPGEIKEGDDVYFECNVRANPKEHRIHWFHDEKPVVQNISSGVIISSHSLVLQKVTRIQGGYYSCNVHNTIGETSSQLVKLRVQYAPICALASPLVIGGRIDETISIKCVVSGDPTDTSFIWLFNNSGESYQVSSDKYESSGVTSVLRFHASNEREYGALVCRAQNAVGTQKKPCVFQVLPAARPASPRNCRINTTAPSFNEAISIKCQPGYDGGLTQHFLLEAVVNDNDRILLVNSSANNSDDLIIFTMLARHLPDSREAELIVYAKNLKGISDPVLLEKIQIPVYNEATSESITKATSNFPMSILLIVSLATLAIICVVLLLLVKRKTRHSTSTQSKRPTQTVVQVDSTGRSYVVAYPDKPEKQKPDIINAKPDRCSSRVILESCESSKGPPSIELGTANGLVVTHEINHHEVSPR